MIGLDWRVRLDEGWERVGHDRGVQGNLDPALLLGPFDRVEREALAILERAGGRPGHIFNLGHGVLPDTDPADLQPARRARPRADRERRSVKPAVVLMAYGSPSDLDGHPPLSRGHPRRQAGLGRGGRGAHGALPADRRALAARRRDGGDRARRSNGSWGSPVYVGHEALEPENRGGGRAGARGRRGHGRRPRPRAALLDALDRRLPRAARARRSRAAPSSGSSRAGTTHEPYLDVLADRVRGTDAHVVFTAHSLPARILDQGDPYRDQLLETSRLVAERAGLESLVVRVPERERDRRAVARPGHPRRARRPPCPRRRARPRLPDRLRLRPSRDPLGHRRRGAGSAPRSSASTFDRIESLNDDPAFVRGLAELCPRGRFSTLDVMEPGQIVARARQSPLPRKPAAEPHAQGGDPAPGDASRRGDLGAARRLARGRAGRLDRVRRPKRLGQDDAPAADRGHLRADDGPPRGGRLGRLAARARRGLPPRFHRPREHLPQRLDLRAQAALRRRSGSTRSSRSRSSSGSSTFPCGRTRRGCTCGSASRSPCTCDADILLLDEVFAVGDEAFQRKCIDKILEFKQRGGTVCFVSHSAPAVERLCERAVLLSQGPGRVRRRRPQRRSAATTQQLALEESPRRSAPSCASGGRGEVRVAGRRSRRARDGAARERFVSGEPVVDPTAARRRAGRAAAGPVARAAGLGRVAARREQPRSRRARLGRRPGRAASFASRSTVCRSARASSRSASR